MKMILASLALSIVISPTQASLVCKGKAFGIDCIYTFTRTDSKKLTHHIKTTIGSEQILDVSSIALYASTVEGELLGDKYVSESYYYFVHGKDSYTELLGISADLKSMARSRPDPDSSFGNFIRFKCDGFF
jgi:hypothetical protein